MDAAAGHTRRTPKRSSGFSPTHVELQLTSHSRRMDSLTIFSPAKINLFLAVTGRRSDGFHDLVSVVAPLAFGDTLRLTRTRGVGDVRLNCEHPAVPAGPDNLAVRAAEAFRAASGIRDGVTIELVKRTPLGAGLGGGSSNAVAVLRGLNVIHGEPLSLEKLHDLAATLGSDCPLFLVGGVCVIRGRGERIQQLAPPMRKRFAAVRVLLFKPDFGVATPWAYARLVATENAYIPAADAESRMTAWFASHDRVATLLLNNFEPVVFRKFVALPVLMDELRSWDGVDGVLLSGSGSAGFAVLHASADAGELTQMIRTRLGANAFVQETTVA
jgi:4-diphosphocytidyl-2-C-methyl-D-erythritol kinase